MRTLPLAGITVVSVEQAVAAPFATRQLADLGARVIKVERPDGGDFARAYDSTVKGLSSYFVWLNRSKESLTLDLKTAETRAMLDQLIAKADVFVQNLAPGAAERMGLDGEALLARHPSLVVCNVSGYGSSGPFATKKAYDLLVQGETGAIATTGTPDTPSKVGISIADIAAGMYAYSSVLAALFARTQTGKGAIIEVSLFDALGEWMSAPMYYTKYGGKPPVRSGAAHASIAPYGPFATGDGGKILLGIQNAREWERFCAQVLRRPALATDSRFLTNSDRVRHRDALSVEINGIFRDKTTSTVLTLLDAAGIANARLNGVADFAKHEQLRSRGRWAPVDSPVGPIDMLKPPAMPNDLEAPMGAIPALGQHTKAILTELGLDEFTIGSWRQKGLI